MVLVRKASEADAEAVYQMICELEETQLDQARFREKFAAARTHPDVHYLVAVHGGVAVGFISLWVSHPLHHERPVGEIQELFVQIAFRSHRIGKRLLEAILEIAQVQGIESLEVATNIKRERALKFYIRNGFQQTHYKLCYRL